MPKNYYFVLGVPADATQDEIKSAYRQRALECHPDRTGAGRGPFQDIQEAYTVLSDPDRRRDYDLGRDDPRRSEEGYPSYAEPLRAASWPAREMPGFAEDVFVSQFEPRPQDLTESLWGSLGWASFSETTIDVALTPQQARFGGRVRLELPVETVCPTCGGCGSAGFFLCRDCLGDGVVQEVYPVLVGFPPGIVSTHTVQVPMRQWGSTRRLTVRFWVR